MPKMLKRAHFSWRFNLWEGREKTAKIRGFHWKRKMRPEIHPEYREVLFHDTSADAYFLIGSTVAANETREYEGKTYPYVTIDVSSASHPFYTGKQKSAQSDGRVARFNKRYGRQAKS